MELELGQHLVAGVDVTGENEPVRPGVVEERAMLGHAAERVEVANGRVLAEQVQAAAEQDRLLHRQLSQLVLRLLALDDHLALAGVLQELLHEVEHQVVLLDRRAAQL